MTRRVLTAQIKHETNTFSILPTTLDSYNARVFLEGDAVLPALKGTNNEIAGVLDVATQGGWDLVTPIAADATPSGRVSAPTWAYLKSSVLDALESGGPFDAVCLSLHGAMVTQTCEDAEGELVAAVRQRVGPDTPVLVTLDLHANATRLLADNASVLISYRTYPHIDMYDRGRQMAVMAGRMMTGEIGRAQTVIARREQLDGFDHGRTTHDGPMNEALRRARAFEAEDGILCVSINAGFPWADITDAGPSVTVSHDGRPARAREIANSIIQFGWDTRHDLTIKHLSANDALTRIKTAGPGNGPFVLGDFSDNPGGGSYGDSPALLQAMVEGGLENAAFAVICDPEAAQAAVQAGVGATLTMPLGGKFDPTVTPSFEMTGTVKHISPEGKFTFEGPMMRGVSAAMGPSALLQIGGVETVVISNRFQPYDRMFLVHFGVTPEEKSVIAVKSAHHFRAAYGPMAREILLVDAAGITSPDPRKFPFKNLRRPIWPLDID
jgi:microcystin degradation protein MlrC